MLDSHAEHAADIRVEDVRFAAGDAELAGQLYHPAGPAKAAVVLNGATGVPQGYYRHFARWLAAERQMACLTYDYRDFGASARVHPRRSKATMGDWALADQPAARTEMQRHYAGVPMYLIGHSLGAMLMPLQESLTDVARMIVVAGGLVHHHDHPWPYRALALAFWFGHVPPLVRALGYLPGRAVGFGADLPAGVYWQWRRWCTTPGSYLPETGTTLPQPRWAETGIPVDLFAMADDDVVPPPAVWRLGDVYGDVRQRRIVLDPKEAGVRKIGHLGAFARANAPLWPRLVPQL
jgi:predicted alpha/beta hydrolase